MPDTEYICPHCGALLTDNYHQATKWVGGKSDWRCATCHEVPYCISCGVELAKKNMTGYCPKHQKKHAGDEAL
jgi:predicted RNA-binding Zn-ribbon protein involved in translation (DUF1610 family)